MRSNAHLRGFDPSFAILLYTVHCSIRSVVFKHHLDN